MLSSYLNQTAEYKTVIDTDDRGQPIYGAPQIITARKQATTRNVLNTTGQTIQAQHIYYTKHPVKEGDSIDGKIIIVVFEWTGLGGNIEGYKAVV